jgi:hypothetical protein
MITHAALVERHKGRKVTEFVICFDGEETTARKVATDAGAVVIAEGRITEQVTTPKGVRWNVVLGDGTPRTFKAGSRTREKS